jgi:NAD+ kinase
MRVFVLGNADRPGVEAAAARLLPYLSQHVEVVVADLRQERDLEKLDADIALVLGGDGAILRAARQMAYKQIPVLGINLGKLGFLADLSLEDVFAKLPGMVRGEFSVTKHVMLECALTQAPGHKLLALNELCIHSGTSLHMIELELSVDGETVTRFTGDGLLVATPIGSTAHNLSAGGPIVEQALEAVVITPICSHSLTVRPVVDSSCKEYQISLSGRCRDAVMIVDGEEVTPLSPIERIVVRRAPVDFRLVKVPGRTYYQTLRDKLRWGTPPNYRSEPPGQS